MAAFFQDFRYSFRQLYKNLGVSLTAIFSLALGIGATVSEFSIIYAVIMNPWPYQGADRIANVALLDKPGHEQDYGLNGPQTRELAKAPSLKYVVALILAAVGLYSVVSYSVAQRTNEFGIRMALGAQGHHVLRIVFASAGVSVGMGVIAGLALSFALNRFIAKWVEIASGSPLILIAVSFLLLAVAALACLLPARRATAVDPMNALRYE
jgi:hypothetical protein